MKQRSAAQKQRGTQAAAPKDFSDIGVDRVHYNPADDFFVVSQEHLSGAKPASRGRKRKPAAKTRPKAPLGCLFMLILVACAGLPALTMMSGPAADTSAALLPDSGAAAGTAETARQEAAEDLENRARLQAQEDAEAVHQAQVQAAAAAAAAAAVRDETVSYENCTDVWNDLGRAILSTEAGYSAELDRDGDGTACESKPSR